MQKSGHSAIQENMRELTKMVLVDEADNFLIQNFQAIRRILKEGREFGVGTILSTQFLDHFSTSDNEYSKYILSWIVHRVSEISQKEISALFGMQSKDRSKEQISEIMKLEKHHSVVNLADNQVKLMRDEAFFEVLKHRST
jgi:DNA phosphorothioation-dependent restriction protein DptH